MANRKPLLFDLEQQTEIPTGPTGLSDELLRATLARRDRLTQKVTRGQCKTMESYAEAVGQLRAFEFILTFAEEKRREAEPNIVADDDLSDNFPLT
jgi:hypothetical protein